MATKLKNNYSESNIWQIKIDSKGTLIWDKTLTTINFDNPFQLGYGIQSHDSCYLGFLSTNAGIGGLKTQPNWDTTENYYDLWLVKFCDTTYNIGLVQLQNHQGEMMIYPNPNKGIFWIKTFIDNSISKSMFIYTITGKLIYKKENVIDNIVQVDLSKEARGIYFVKVIQQNNVMVGKVILE
ncbi:MAG: T9SS type A sorting domain-containing protein [Bacteroidetes bacterium]|nr:T9SS type A sorting domain-containing protein [Bacteroidota bacterium]